MTNGTFAFRYCDNLESIKLPNNIKEINSIFTTDSTASYKIKTITIPKSVTYIFGIYNIFGSFYQLNNIIVEDGNSNYVSIDGVLLTKDLSRLMSYPRGKADESYDIPDGVKEIGGGAFDRCNNLTAINIPDTVTTIEHNVFSGCQKLTELDIPDSVTSIDQNAFGGSGIEKITLSNSLEEIPNMAFYGCQNLKQMYISDSVKVIGGMAFMDCSSLEEIFIPKNVERFNGRDVFRGCVKLKNIAVANDNNSFCSVDSVLFNKDMTELITYPPQKPAISYSIPSCVIKVSEHAFMDNANLTDIRIPYGITDIRRGSW